MQARALFSHTAPTGYDPHGVCVPHDGFGLSAQLLWLRSMLDSREVRMHLKPAAAARLRDTTERCAARPWPRGYREEGG